MKLGIALILFCDCCLAQAPARPPTVNQTSNGVCSPNILGVDGNLTIQCGNDPKEFENVVAEYMKAIRERDRVAAELRSTKELLATQERLSAQDRLQLQETLTEKDTELAVKTAQVKGWETKYRQLADELRISEEAKASTLRQLQNETQRASSLELTAAAGLLDANPTEHRRAVTLALRAMREVFSFTTASSALRELLSLSGPTINEVIYKGFSADGSKIIAVTGANDLYVWDVATGSLLRSMEGNGPLDPLDGVLKPRNSDWIVTFSRSGEVTVWVCSTLEKITTFRIQKSEYDFWLKSVSDDGAVLAESVQPVGEKKPSLINVWNLKTGSKWATLSPPGQVGSLGVSQNGMIIVSAPHAGSDGTVSVWKIGIPMALREYRTNGIVKIMGGPGNQVWGVVPRKKSNEIWDLTTARRIQVVELPQNVDAENYEIHLSYPNFVWHGSDLDVWLLRIGESRALLHVVLPQSLGVDPSGRFAFVSSFAYGTKLINLEFQEVYDLGRDFIGAPTFSSSGNLVVASTKSGVAAWRTADAVPIWDGRLKENTLTAIMPRHGSAVRIQTSPPDFVDGRIRQGFVIKDIEYSDQWAVRNSRKDDNFTLGANFSSNGRFMIECHIDRSCQVINYQTRTIVGHYGTGTNVDSQHILVSDDGRSILFVVPSFKSGSAELRIWGDSLHAPKVVLPLRQQPSAISATGDFRFVAVAYGNATAELIDLETGTREPILENGSEVSALDFSGDGNLLAAGGRDGSIVLWKVSSRMKVRSFQLPNPVERLRLSREGRLLAVAAGSEGRNERRLVRLWDTDKSVPILEFSMFSPVRGINFSQDEESLIAVDGGGPIVVPFTYKSLSRALCRMLVPLSHNDFSASFSVNDICTSLHSH